MEDLLPQEATTEYFKESSLLSTHDPLSVDSNEWTLLTLPEGCQINIYGNATAWLGYKDDDNLILLLGQVGAKIGVIEQIML